MIAKIAGASDADLFHVLNIYGVDLMKWGRSVGVLTEKYRFGP